MNLKDIKKVSCIGAGVIGYSFALIMALKKLNVYVYDINDEAILLAKKRVHESLKPLIDNGVCSQGEAENIEKAFIIQLIWKMLLLIPILFKNQDQSIMKLNGK